MIGRLSISGFGSNNSTMSTHFHVGTTDKIISIRGDRQRRKQKRMFIILRTLYLDDEAFREYSRPKYGAKINEKAKSRALQILDVMNQYRETRIYGYMLKGMMNSPAEG